MLSFLPLLSSDREVKLFGGIHLDAEGYRERSVDCSGHCRSFLPQSAQSDRVTVRVGNLTFSKEAAFAEFFRAADQQMYERNTKAAIA